MIITKKKELTYRGKTLKELQELEVREFAKYLQSRKRRTVLRNFRVLEDFVSRIKEKSARGKKIRTHCRDLVVVPAMVGMKIAVYDGHAFVPIDITLEMLGHKLGEFAPSRRKVQHGSAGVGATKGSKHQSKK